MKIETNCTVEVDFEELFNNLNYKSKREFFENCIDGNFRVDEVFSENSIEDFLDDYSNDYGYTRDRNMY